MYTSDPNPVPVTYDDQELLSLIDKYLSEMSGEFSYMGVCRYVVNEAKRNNKVEDAPIPNIPVAILVLLMESG